MKQSLLLLVAATCLLISCSKNNNDSPGNPNPPAGSIKVKTFTGSGGTNSYTYDSKGRLLLRQYGNGAKTEFDYSNPNKVIETYYFPDGTLEGIAEMDLNAAGLVVKKVYSDGGPNLYTTEYDADKNVIKEVNTANGNVSISDYFYTNGSLDSIRYKWNGNHHYTVFNTYYTDKADVLNNDAWGLGHEGYYGKYLLKQEETRYADGSPGSIWAYTYEFDAKGRVVKRIAEGTYNIDIDYYTYY